LELVKKGEKDLEKLSEAVHEGWAKVAMSYESRRRVSDYCPSRNTV